jgi:excisionase family DNA binding protein
MTTAHDAPPGWLTTDEVAELAKCSRETVVRAIHSKQLIDVRQGSGGAWLINRDEGIRWAREYLPYKGLRKLE